MPYVCVECGRQFKGDLPPPRHLCLQRSAVFVAVLLLFVGALIGLTLWLY
jgi:hypothetical protein